MLLKPDEVLAALAGAAIAFLAIVIAITRYWTTTPRGKR